MVSQLGMCSIARHGPARPKQSFRAGTGQAVIRYSFGTMKKILLNSLKLVFTAYEICSYSSLYKRTILYFCTYILRNSKAQSKNNSFHALLIGQILSDLTVTTNGIESVKTHDC